MSAPEGTDERVVFENSLLKVTTFAGASGLRFHGDIDGCNIDHAGAAVADAVLGGEREVYLDLDGLDFCGIEGLRLFVGTAQHLDTQGRELVLCSVAPHLVRILRLLDWDCVPGLFLVPRRSAVRSVRGAGQAGRRMDGVRFPIRKPESVPRSA